MRNACLFVEDADRASVGGPCVGIAGVPPLVPFARVVAPPIGVECGGLFAREHRIPVVAALREVGVDRRTGRRE